MRPFVGFLSSTCIACLCIYKAHNVHGSTAGCAIAQQQQLAHRCSLPNTCKSVVLAELPPPASLQQLQLFDSDSALPFCTHRTAWWLNIFPSYTDEEKSNIYKTIWQRITAGTLNVAEYGAPGGKK